MQEPEKIFASGLYHILEPLAEQHDQHIRNIQQSQTQLAEKIDNLIKEIQYCSSQCEFVDVSPHLFKLASARKKMNTIATTLNNISYRLNRLIQNAKTKYPELNKLRQQRLEKQQSSEKVVENDDKPKIEEKKEEEKKEEEKKEEERKDDFVPKLLDCKEPTILETEQLKKIHSALPVRLQFKNWKLVYSTRQHGISLNTFYRNSKDKGPTILVVKNENGEIFGGFASTSWEVSGQKYFGTGETFLFTFYPDFKVLRWTKKNDYFLIAQENSIAFGGGEHFGLYLDQDFKDGSSSPCETFGEIPQGLTKEKDFKILYVELWGFEEITSEKNK